MTTTNSLDHAARLSSWTTLRGRRQFEHHWIRESVETPTFCSWLLKSRGRSEFWCRISAGHGFVQVFGDFGPCTFAYGPRDPITCLHWIASAPGGYLKEKAIMGSGRASALEYDVEFARADLREMIAECRAEDEEDENRAAYLAILNAGLKSADEFDGEVGVHEICQAMRAADEGDEFDWSDMLPDGFGTRLNPEFELAREAIQRLLWLR